MNHRAINVWFVCKLCRGFFRQMDEFIEHKKEEHFPEFQKTSCIVFEETEYDMHPFGTTCHLSRGCQRLHCPVIIRDGNQLTDENIEPPIKIEVNFDDPIIPFSLDIIDEPNLCLVEPKSELITYQSEIIAEAENSYIRLQQPKPNPYVLLERLTSDEIQRACIPEQHCKLVNNEQKIFANNSESPNTSHGDSTISDHFEVEESAEIQSTVTVINSSEERDVQFECKLCSKQLESDGHLKIHVGICALYHKDRKRFCVKCNKKFFHPPGLKIHCKTYHGTEEEKASLNKFKCHVCPNQYRFAANLKYHLQSHKTEKKQFKTSKSKLLKCSHPNCGKEFISDSHLRRHTATHFDLRPFSCSNCNKKFTQKAHLKAHLRTHTGERPFKCTVDNCNKTFTKSYNLSIHCLSAHRT